jgi:hypothetical protein
MIAVRLLGLLALSLSVPTTTLPPLLSPAQEKIVRNSVYGKQPLIRAIPMEGLDEIVVPKELAEVYKDHPRETILVLLAIIDGAKPDDSVLAAAYAIALLHGAPVGPVCYKFYDRKTYDDVDEDWETTPRKHWRGKVRESFAKRWK